MHGIDQPRLTLRQDPWHVPRCAAAATTFAFVAGLRRCKWRQWRLARRHEGHSHEGEAGHEGKAHSHEHGEAHCHDHGEDSHEHGDAHSHDHGKAHSHDHGEAHSHDHGEAHSHDHGDAHDHGHGHGGLYGHGHSHGDVPEWLPGASMFQRLSDSRQEIAQLVT